MARNLKARVVALRETSIVGEGGAAEHRPDGEVVHLNGQRRFPIVSTTPRLPLMIPDEIIDYYGWVFCQGGFSNLQMTFEQFLSVVAAVSPNGLCPEYDEGESPAMSD